MRQPILIFSDSSSWLGNEHARVTTDRKTGSKINRVRGQRGRKWVEFRELVGLSDKWAEHCQGSGAGVTGGPEEQTGRERQTDRQEMWALTKLRSNAH